jgi:hypothetical protein
MEAICDRNTPNDEPKLAKELPRVDLGYVITHEGRLVDAVSGTTFPLRGSSRDYNALKRAVLVYLYQQLQQRCHLRPFYFKEETPSSLDSDLFFVSSSGSQSNTSDDISSTQPFDFETTPVASAAFVSNNLDACSRLLILAKGAGAHTGQWSMHGCVQQNLHEYAMLDHVRRAKKLGEIAANLGGNDDSDTVNSGMGVIILNPNLQCFANDERRAVYLQHFWLVWRRLIRPWLLKRRSTESGELALIDVIAFSFGGVTLCDFFNTLERENENQEVEDRREQHCKENRARKSDTRATPYRFFRRVVFLDSVHDESHVAQLSRAGQRFLRQSAIHFRLAKCASHSSNEEVEVMYYGRLATMRASGYSARTGCHVIDVFDNTPTAISSSGTVDFRGSITHERVPFVTIDETFLFLEGREHHLFASLNDSENESMVRSLFGSPLTVLYLWIGFTLVFGISTGY